jgi:hypothetical protein
VEAQSGPFYAFAELAAVTCVTRTGDRPRNFHRILIFAQHSSTPQPLDSSAYEVEQARKGLKACARDGVRAFQFLR